MGDVAGKVQLELEICAQWDPTGPEETQQVQVRSGLISHIFHRLYCIYLFILVIASSLHVSSCLAHRGKLVKKNVGL